MNPQIERCHKCQSEAVAEIVPADRVRVRCLGCGAVEVPCFFPTVAVDIWNEAQRGRREAAAIIKSGEGAGDKLREDAP